MHNKKIHNNPLHLTQNPLGFLGRLYCYQKFCGSSTVYLLGFWAGELGRWLIMNINNMIIDGMAESIPTITPKRR